jgi:L-malate glycosyltransferase
MGNKNKIKIIYIINGSDPYGANKALINILDEIVGYGVQPMVITGQKGYICELLELRGITYTIVPLQLSVYPSIINYNIRNYITFFPRLLVLLYHNYIAAQKIKQITRKFNPDIIHTNIGPVHVGYSVAKKLGIPHVWHIREYQDLDFGWNPIPSKRQFKKKLKYANNFPIVITYGILDHYSLQSKAKVIFDGVMKKSQKLFFPIKEKYFLFVGRLEEAKGIRILIEAFKDFCQYNNDYNLQIAGDGLLSYISELYQLVDEAKITHRIRFLGYRNDIDKLMAKATALIVPSRNEGFGFITVEAMFSGCLVIGNKTGGTKEILEKENLGILYSGHEELVNSMRKIVSDGIESYFPMIRKAQEHAIALYSQEQNAEAIFNFYTDILNK